MAQGRLRPFAFKIEQGSRLRIFALCLGRNFAAHLGTFVAALLVILFTPSLSEFFSQTLTNLKI